MLDYREMTSRSQDMIDRIHTAAENRDLAESATERENPSVTQHITGMIASMRRKLFSENAHNHITMQSTGRPLRD